MAQPSSFSFGTASLVREERLMTFSYESSFEDETVLSFTETVRFPGKPDFDRLPEAFLETLHLALGVSYYKLYCPPELRIPYVLAPEDAAFWETVYRKGLGEFAYRNELDLSKIRFPVSPEAKSARPMRLSRTGRALVGIGGGKDSIVALELLREHGFPHEGFIVKAQGPHAHAEGVGMLADLAPLIIERELDEKVYAGLPGAYGGHVPISAIYALLGLAAAALYGYDDVIVGNEHSSNFGNLEWKGETVNHQWSKSLEFETLLADYARRRLSPDLRYFSLLRPFYELRIARMFAPYARKYAGHFTSCNRAFSSDPAKRPRGRWCGECPKCLFTFLILAPFVERQELAAIFEDDLLAREDRLEGFGDILGFGGMKPFDCVGTFEEARAALYLAREAYAGSPVMEAYLSRIEDGKRLAEEALRVVPSPSVPTRYRFLGMASCLILGYGREGKATEAYLRKRYPHLMLATADESDGPDYLAKQDAFDILVKTPGIPKEHVHIHYATATNMFFAEKRWPVVGVTGSKGKSTTASLIAAMLAEGGKNVRLAGNIGVPLLSLLDEELPDETIVVAELSSYQLDDIESSPEIALVTSLFPDHMDYHGGERPYYEAKKNIVRFQCDGDAFVYNPAFPELERWAKETPGETVPYIELFFSEEEIPLLGKHNADNVRGAATAAKHLGVPDDAILHAVRSFKGLPHRLEYVGEYNGIRFYDDAISTTPESTIVALDAIPDVGTIFLGGKDRGYDFSALEAKVQEKGIHNVVLFPESGKRMFKERNGLAILETSDMEEAVRFAYEKTPVGKAVLLSTASPSYGIWKNFEEKGSAFKAAAKKFM